MSDNIVSQSGTQSDEPKSGKTAQKLKFYVVVSIMVLLCGGFIWFLFSPKNTIQPEGATGLNTNVPAATVKNTEDDKRKIYETEQHKERLRDKQKTLQEISDNFLTPGQSERKPTEPKADPIRTSHETYRQINQQMTSFYQTPKEDPQVADLKRQVMELSARLDQKEKAPEPADPMELIEKSYALAAKYYPGNGAQPVKSIPTTGTDANKEPTVAVRRTADATTSTLAEPAPLTLEERN